MRKIIALSVCMFILMSFSSLSVYASVEGSTEIISQGQTQIDSPNDDPSANEQQQNQNSQSEETTQTIPDEKKQGDRAIQQEQQQQPPQGQPTVYVIPKDPVEVVDQPDPKLTEVLDTKHEVKEEKKEVKASIPKESTENFPATGLEQTPGALSQIALVLGAVLSLGLAIKIKSQ